MYYRKTDRAPKRNYGARSRMERDSSNIEQSGLTAASDGFRLRGKVFFDEEGKPSRWIGINIDVTERKQMDESLRRPRPGRFERPTAARTSSWRRWPTSCATRSPPSATPCRSCELRGADPAASWRSRRDDGAAGRADGPAGGRPAGRVAASPAARSSCAGSAVDLADGASHAPSRPAARSSRPGSHDTDGRRCRPSRSALRRRPDAAGAGVRQPAQQRRQVHRAGRPHLADRRAARAARS